MPLTEGAESFTIVALNVPRGASVLEAEILLARRYARTSSDPLNLIRVTPA